MASEAHHDPAPDSAAGTDDAGMPCGLYVVATPLGRLDDMSPHAVAVLSRVDAIAAEDTRTSATLFAAHGIRTRAFAAHEHNEGEAARRVLALLEQGRSVALISDAGTPAISDPGARIVRAVLEAGRRVIPVPGPSAVTCALSAAGFEGAFHFHGFLPAKSAARRERLRALAHAADTQVFYEAPHRIAEFAHDLALEWGGSRRVVVARELTKRFETVHATTSGMLEAWLAADDNHRRGEFVVMVEGAAAQERDGAADDRVLALLLGELPLRSAARLAAAITGAPRNALYKRALELKGEADADSAT